MRQEPKLSTLSIKNDSRGLSQLQWFIILQLRSCGKVFPLQGRSTKHTKIPERSQVATSIEYEYSTVATTSPKAVSAPALCRNITILKEKQTLLKAASMAQC